MYMLICIVKCVNTKDLMAERNSCIPILCSLKILGTEQCVAASHNLSEHEYKSRGFSWNTYTCIFRIFHAFGFN